MSSVLPEIRKSKILYFSLSEFQYSANFTLGLDLFKLFTNEMNTKDCQNGMSKKFI